MYLCALAQTVPLLSSGVIIIGTILTFMSLCRKAHKHLDTFMHYHGIIVSIGDDAQTCTNVPGSFTCSCRNGYLIAPDGRGCNGKCLNNMAAFNLDGPSKPQDSQPCMLMSVEPGYNMDNNPLYFINNEPHFTKQGNSPI